MTDDFDKDPLVRELEQIERSTPAIPPTYNTLRQLLSSLPNPQLPDVQSARSGVASPEQTQALGAGGVSSAMAGIPPGFESGAGVGIYPSIYFGLANLLPDPTFESVEYSAYPGSPNAITTAEEVIGQIAAGTGAWWGQQIGATSATMSVSGGHHRDDPDVTPFNSSSVSCEIDPTGSGTHELRIRSSSWDGSAAPAYPYLVAAVRVTCDVTNVNTLITSRTLVVEVYDVTAAVVRASQSIPLDGFAAFDQSRLAVASLPYAGQAWEGNLFQLRVRLVVVSTGNASPQEYLIGEPQLVQSQTASPPPYAPIVASWFPTGIRSFGTSLGSKIIDAGQRTDTGARFSVTDEGTIGWGPGPAAQDIIISRETRDPGQPSGSAGALLRAQVDTPADAFDTFDVLSIGWLPYVYAMFGNPANDGSSSHALAANGGTLVVPFFLPSQMVARSLTYRSNDVASARSCEFRLYRQRLHSTGPSLDEVAGFNGTDSFTPGAASNRTVSTGAQYLAPGLYWLAFRNTHATNTFSVGCEAAGTLNANGYQSKTLGSALGATLDMTAATWAKHTFLIAMRFDGSVFGQSTAF